MKASPSGASVKPREQASGKTSRARRPEIGSVATPLKQVTAEAMALPLKKRVSLPQALWQSIQAGLSDADEGATIAAAIRQDEELTSGAVAARSHEEVIDAARRALG